jgi:hypothetical protein
MGNRISTAIVLLLGLCHCGDAEVHGGTISSDTVLGPDHPFPEQTITVIDGVNSPTEVTVVEGALVGDVIGGENIQVGFDVFGQSKIKMQGGVLRGAQQAAIMHDASIFHMFNGLIHVGSIESRDSSRVVLENGEWSSVVAYDNSRVRVNGGAENSVFSVRTFGESHAVINSDVHLDFLANESSTAVINHGDFEIAWAGGNSEVLINGGYYANVGIQAVENAVVQIRGIDGIAEERIEVLDSATVHFYGTGLRFDEDVFPNTGPVVVGTFANGEPINVRYRLQDQGQIILHEVPEPAAGALLAIGAAGWAFFRRRRAG